MRRLSIARSLRLALIGLAVVLAIVAAGGVASLYSARQRYEDTLAQTSQLGTAVANLTSAGIAEAEVLRDGTGAVAAAARRESDRAFRRAAAAATRLARSDPRSARLVAAEIARQGSVRRLAASGRAGLAIGGAGPLTQEGSLATRIQARQRTRQTAASRTARSQSRQAIALIIGAGLFALVAALALITVLVRSMRGPLDELVDATQGFAAGELTRRVVPSGPRELRDLGVAFNAMGTDLATAHRRIEQDRRRLAVTIASLGDGLLVTEPGSPTIATTNPRAMELLPELGPGASIAGENSPLPAVKRALEGETMIEHAGRTLAVTAAPIRAVAEDENAKDGGIVWTVRDVTERARLERAKSDFVATASHELRSPLTSIKGFVELLEHKPEAMSARQREFVDIIRRSTDRLVELVNDLLDVARIEADRVEISRRPTDVGEAVNEVVELMKPRIAERGQHLGVQVAPGLALAQADPGRIRQIVANLLTNAHLYTGDGGRIQVSVEGDRAWVRIVVADSGVGMTADEQAHAFDRFYRADSSAGLTSGTGLGLWIVRSLVELHDGEIKVESEPGRGTTFRVLIPAAVAAEESDRSLEVIRGRRILIVDDEREIAELIARQLAPLEVQATIAVSGEQALARLREEHYDAVTLDILMPGHDGFEVLRQVRSDPELRLIPIVFVSVFAGSKDLAGEWVVSKPIDADELLDVLAAAVHAGRSRVLVVGRSEMQPSLEPTLDELGIEHHWECSDGGAARVCEQRRFEVALIDVGIHDPQATLRALDLRGRRLRRAVILFSDGGTATPSGIVKLGMEVVPVEDAAQALLAALHGDFKQTRFGDGWSSAATLSWPKK